MQNASDPYEDVAFVYTRLVRQESPEAAAVVEQIHAAFGAHAALRATLIITLLKMEIQHHPSIPEMSMYTYLLKDSPAAIPLLKDAITCCLKSWGLPQIDVSERETSQQALETDRVHSRSPFDDLLQRVHQRGPITARKLEQIHKNYGLTAGCYAAAALIWLQARVDMFGYGILVQLTDLEIREFTYFQYMSKNTEALDQFVEMLECYRVEQRPTSVRFAQVAPFHTLK